jgi:hypothetical protein
MIEFSRFIPQFDMSRVIAGQTVTEDSVVTSRYFSTFAFNDEARITIVPNNEGEKSLMLEQKYTEVFVTSRAPFTTWQRFSSVSVLPRFYNFSNSSETLYWYPRGNYLDSEPRVFLTPPVGELPLTVSREIDFGRAPGVKVFGDEALINFITATNDNEILELTIDEITILRSRLVEFEIDEENAVITNDSYIAFMIPSTNNIPIPRNLGIVDEPRQVERDFESMTLRERLSWHPTLEEFQDDTYLSIDGENAVYGLNSTIYPDWL